MVLPDESRRRHDQFYTFELTHWRDSLPRQRQLFRTTVATNACKPRTVRQQPTHTSWCETSTGSRANRSTTRPTREWALRYDRSFAKRATGNLAVKSPRRLLQTCDQTKLASLQQLAPSLNILALSSNNIRIAITICISYFTVFSYSFSKSKNVYPLVPGFLLPSLV